MPTVSASVLSALIRDRSSVVALGDALRHRAADGDTLVGSIAFPFPVVMATILFRAMPAKASGPGVIVPAGKWTATVRVAGVEVASLAIDLATLDGAKSVALPGSPSANAGDVVEVGLSPASGATAIDGPSFSIWYLPS